MAKAYAYRGHGSFLAAIRPRMEKAGFVQTDSPEAADAVITFMTSQSELEECYFGDAGLVSACAPDTLVVDASPMTPGFAREVSAVATVSDLVMVEAPLVLEDIAALRAFAVENLRCFAAGEDSGLKRARPVLDALFGTVEITGAYGSAQLARAAWTLQTVAALISAVESCALYHAVRRSPLGSAVAKGTPPAPVREAARIFDALADERFDGAYTVEMLMAEVSAAIMAADDAELILPQAEAAMHLLELLAVIGGQDKAPAALALVYGEEEECAEHGLDWTRAEQAYGQGHDHDCDCGHDHGDSYDDDMLADDEFDDDPYDDGYSGYGFSDN